MPVVPSRAVRHVRIALGFLAFSVVIGGGALVFGEDTDWGPLPGLTLPAVAAAILAPALAPLAARDRPRLFRVLCVAGGALLLLAGLPLSLYGVGIPLAAAGGFLVIAARATRPLRPTPSRGDDASAGRR